MIPHRAALLVLAAIASAACSPPNEPRTGDDASSPPRPFIGVEMPAPAYPWHLGEELRGAELERLGSNETLPLLDGDTWLVANGGSNLRPAAAPVGMRSGGDPHLDEQGCTLFPIVAYNWEFHEVDRLPPGTCFESRGETWEYHWELVSDAWSEGFAPHDLTVVNNTAFDVAIHEHVYSCDRVHALEDRGIYWSGDLSGGDPRQTGYGCEIRFLTRSLRPSESAVLMPFDRDANECTIGLFSATWEDPPSGPADDGVVLGSDDAATGDRHVVYHDTGICLRDGPVTWTIDEADEVESTADLKLPNLDARYAAEVAAPDAAQAPTTTP